jgi:HPt (histidine-containing phosphotransfer) domain-containing protein
MNNYNSFNEINNIDFNHINDVANGDAQVKKDIIDIFLKQTPELITQLNEFSNAKDLENMKLVAHKLKPMFNYVGMIELHNISQEIDEKECTNENLYLIELLANKICSGYITARQHLVDFREKLPL